MMQHLRVENFETELAGLLETLFCLNFCFYEVEPLHLLILLLGFGAKIEDWAEKGLDLQHNSTSSE